MQLVNGGVSEISHVSLRDGSPTKIVKCAYGGLAYFRCVLESRSRIVRCFRIGHLACKEYRIKVVTVVSKRLYSVMFVFIFFLISVSLIKKLLRIYIIKMLYTSKAY